MAVIRLGCTLVLFVLFGLPLAASAQSLVVGPLAAGSTLEALPDRWVRSGETHTVLLPSGDARIASLQSTGAVLRTWDYDSFQVFVVQGLGPDQLQAGNYPVRDEFDLLPASGYLLDGRNPQPTLAKLHPAERFPAMDDGSLLQGVGLYLLKFEAPIQDSWLAELDATGAQRLQPMPMNAYVVRATGDAVQALSAFGRTHPAVQHVGAWEPAFRMAPSVRAAAETAGGAPMPITIQFVDGPSVREAVSMMTSFASEVSHSSRVGPYVNLAVKLDPALFRTLASWPEVFAIEPRGTPAKNDERQGQIVSGNISGTNPSGPGYLSWLAGEGFNSSQFGSFSVNVVDDSVSLTGHPDLANARVDFSLNPTSQGSTEGGHGFLNAHIVAGLNSSTGGTVEDAQGYNYGLGIAPWAHVGSTAIFGPSGASITSWENSAYNLGARISSNSWSFIDGAQNPIPDYDSNSQEVDGLVRDARSGQSGNQEYTILFAAGNDGPGANTVSTPSTGKNIITVGASENVRQTGTDGCGVGNSGADDLTDMISFSSHGPINSTGGDGRIKPEIVAPGTHIQAGVPQSNYGGTSVCNAFWPAGSSLYGWSSGTSHSTPAVAGGAALVRQDFLNNGMSAPSPAMIKAVLMNSARYMTGAFANDTLPSNVQGMGLMDLDRAFDATTRMLVDQSVVLGSTGATHVVLGQVADPGQPFRVTLAWTDAPGPTTGAPWVNDLDLQLSVGGNTYRGNVFSGANSITGGSADFRNNAESVFLPAGTSGNFTVTVSAASISGNGLPGNADGTDQDFALLVYNAGAPGGGPIAAFNGTPTSGLTPLNVNFTDLSSGSPDTWAWTFGDGGVSSAQNPSNTYTSAGTYTVSLMVSGPSGSDTNTKVGYITVNDPPPAGISDGSFESQTAGTTPTTPWSVSFGSGHVVNPTGVSSDNGMPTDGSQWGEIAGDSTNGATPPSNPGGITTPPIGGAGIEQSFTYPAGNTLLKFSAAFLRNEDPNQAVYNDWMSVELTDGSSTYNVFYKDTFSPTSGTSAKWGYAMTPLEEVVVDLTSLFPSSTTATSFTLTASTGNGDDDFQDSKGYLDDLRLEPPAGGPVAEFSGVPTSGTAPLLVNFSDLSTGGPVTSWVWAFGDSTFSTQQNPSHTYTAAGTYTVTLTATGPGGSDGETKTAYITVNEPAPVAEFSGTPVSGTLPLLVNFSDLSSGGPVTSWAWNFGDTATSTAQNPSHTYTTAGTYTVTLTATGPGGSDGETKVAYITVNEPAPVAEFSGSPTSGTLPLLVNFGDLSSGGPVTSWAWSFGDTGTSTAQDPSHTYTTPGIYTVTLTATGPGGSDGETKVAYITVNEPAPVAEFSGSPTSGTLPLLVNFSDLSSGGPVTSWVWNFGDTATSTAQNPSHTYTAAGTYTVTLTATGPGGSDGETKVAYITVNEPAPVAEFSGSPTSGTLPLLVNFSDLSSGGPVTSWVWNFGDTATSTAQNPSHTYTAAGTYTVTLTATGPGGSDGETKVAYITVNEPAPVAEFSGSPTSGTLPLLVNFSDLSSGGPVTSWVWNFGDTATSTAQNPSHTYTAAGTYTVTLTATGPGGSDGETKVAYITVNEPAPVAEFSGSPTSGTLPLLVNFSDLSSGGPVTSWVWNFGDTATSTAQNPSHTYTAAGTYTVTLTATGPGGSDGETKVAYIAVNEPAPIAEFSGTPTSGISPLLVNFNDLSSGGPVTSWAWNFGDTGTSTAQDPSHTYTTPGIYTVTLTATGPGGSDGETKVAYITVSDLAPVADFSGTPTSGTMPLLVNFSDASTGGPVTSWAWDFGDTGSSTAQNPSHTYTAAGTYTVTLTATGPGGSDGETKVAYITVNEPAPVAGFSATPLSGTTPLLVDFTDLSSGGPVTSWAWDFGDTNSSTAQNPSNTYTAAGTYTVTLTATGPGGSDGETKVAYISVGELPPVAAFTGTPPTGTAPVVVDFMDQSTGGPSASWLWDFGDGKTSTEQDPSHIYTSPGTYDVSLTVSGPGGADLATELDFVQVKNPKRPLVDGSFEGQAPGLAPSGVWTVLAGGAHVVQPSGLGSDGAMPTAGDQWLELAADGSDAATPPSNPGGAGSLPLGGNSVGQAFSYPLGRHRLSFDAAYLRSGAANSAAANDWMSVDITDGTTTRNLFYADSFSATPNTSGVHGLPMTDVSTIEANLKGLFPASNTKTVFTILLSVGNGGDAANPSKGYVDRVQLDPYRKQAAEGTLTLQ